MHAREKRGENRASKQRQTDSDANRYHIDRRQNYVDSALKKDYNSE